MTSSASASSSTSERVRRVQGNKVVSARLGALRWMRIMGGEGVFARDRRLLARGEFAPYAYKTFEWLLAHGYVENHKPARIRLTNKGQQFLDTSTSKRKSTHDYIMDTDADGGGDNSR